MVRRLGIEPSEPKQEFYRLLRLHNGLPTHYFGVVRLNSRSPSLPGMGSVLIKLGPHCSICLLPQLDGHTNTKGV